MTFEEFCATGREVDDIGAVIQDGLLDGIAGRIYMDSLFIERTPEGYLLLVIMNRDWLEDEDKLPELERHLYDYAEAEGYFA